MNHKIIKSENGEVHYWICKSNNKDAKCIVFTHGLTVNHEMFEDQVLYFCRNYSVITWDIPLHGLSSQYSDFSYDNTAEELNRILEAENIDKVILVGMSMGGYPSQEFAYKYPEKVIGFVALDTTPLGLCYYSKSDIWWLKKADDFAKLYPEKKLKMSMAKSVSRTQNSYDIMMKMLNDSSKNHIIRQIRCAYAKFIDENKDVHFDFPVLILVGEYDKTGKVKDYCRKWSEKEKYPMHIIKDASHLSNVDNPQAVNHEIDTFIRDMCTIYEK